jgi:hypothetical protein
MPKNCLLWAQTNRRQLRRIILFFAVGLSQSVVHLSLHRISLVTPTAPAAPSRYRRVVQDRQNLPWPDPAFHVDFPAYDPARRFRHCLILISACAELAIPVRWNFHPDSGRPQVSDIAKKLHRALAVPIFQFTVRRTHPAQRLDATLDTLRHASASDFAVAGEIPSQTSFTPEPRIPEGLLLRHHANAISPYCIDGKGIHVRRRRNKYVSIQRQTARLL